MSIRDDQLKKVCRILDDVLANRPNERDELIVAVQTVFQKRKGKWIVHLKYNECNLCHQLFTIYSNYCPNCGADMRPDNAPLADDDSIYG